MPKFRAKPKEIEAIFVRTYDDFDQIFHDWEGGFRVWNALHGTWVRFFPPCWINVTDPNDLYPIAPDYMIANYEQIDG